MTTLKKYLILFLICILLGNSFTVYADGLTLSGEGAILMDTVTGEVLYEKDAHKKLYPASTTKIMTAILAVEHGKLDDKVMISNKAVVSASGTHIALEPGEILTLEQLLNALLIESANDAANAIAVHISGSIEAFSVLMNKKAKELGALNTNFVNPSGLPNEAHVTTAYDLALISRYAMEFDIIREISKNYSYTVPVTNKKTEQRYLKSGNKLLFSNEKIDVNGQSVSIKLDGVNGIKSGYTVAAQQCLSVSYEKDGHSFIAVSLKANGKSIYSDIHKLIDYGVSNFENVKIGYPNRFIANYPIKNGADSFISAITSGEFNLILKKGSSEKITEKIVIEEKLTAPIEKNQVIGKIQYLIDDKVVFESDIISTMAIKAIEVPSLFEKIISNWYWGVFLVLFLLRVFVLYKKQQLRKKRQKRRREYYGEQ